MTKFKLDDDGGEYWAEDCVDGHLIGVDPTLVSPPPFELVDWPLPT